MHGTREIFILTRNRMKWNLLFSLAQPCTCPRSQDLVDYQDWKGWNLQELQDSVLGRAAEVVWRLPLPTVKGAAPVKAHREPCLSHSRAAPRVRCQHILERKSWATAAWVQSHMYSSAGNAGDQTQSPLLEPPRLCQTVLSRKQGGCCSSEQWHMGCSSLH